MPTDPSKPSAGAMKAMRSLDECGALRASISRQPGRRAQFKIDLAHLIDAETGHAAAVKKLREALAAIAAVSAGIGDATPLEKRLAERISAALAAMGETP